MTDLASTPQLLLELPNKPIVDDVSDSELLRIPDLLAAVRKCIEISGMSSETVASHIDMDPSHFSKCINGNKARHLDPNKIPVIMMVCQNKIPTRWLAAHGGDELKPRQSTLEQENERLRRELSESQHDMETIKRFIRDTRRGSS